MGQRKDRLDPKQIEFLKNYLNPKSKTFGNAVQSALKAGFTESYANNLMTLMPDWLSENMGDMEMVKKAERNLDEILELPTTKDNSRLKIKSDISKFVVERLNKKKWSERKELTGDEGKPLLIMNNNDAKGN